MIIISDYSKNYQREMIFKGIDMKIEEGEIISVVGPSGTGKSTFLKCIAGLEDASGGSFSIRGEVMSEIPAAKRPVVMMFQQAMLFPHMNILENVMYGLTFLKFNQKQKKDMAKEFLKKVGLARYEKSRPNELSGGQQQRVALARALVTKPKLLLLDEPFSNLDNSLRQEMRTWVKSLLKEHHITAIFVTHDIEESMMMGDRVAVFGEKKLQQIGKPLEVYSNPTNSFVASFYSEGILINKHSFVNTKNIEIVQPELNKNYFKVWEGRVINKRMKHGSSVYDIFLQKIDKKITLHSDNHYSEGDTIKVGIDKEEDLVLFK